MKWSLSRVERGQLLSRRSWPAVSQMPRLQVLPLASTFFIANDAPMVCQVAGGWQAGGRRVTVTGFAGPVSRGRRGLLRA